MQCQWFRKNFISKLDSTISSFIIFLFRLSLDSYPAMSMAICKGTLKSICSQRLIPGKLINSSSKIRAITICRSVTEYSCYVESANVLVSSELLRLANFRLWQTNKYKLQLIAKNGCFCLKLLVNTNHSKTNKLPLLKTHISFQAQVVRISGRYRYDRHLSPSRYSKMHQHYRTYKIFTVENF